jgi:hypothetical protein
MGCRRQRLKSFSAVADSASQFLPVLPTAIKKIILNQTIATFKQSKKSSKAY